MYDPSMRVLTVLELLQTHGRMSGNDLAGRLEVSVRTVQRYVARLQDLGIPVASVRGPGGFYRLRPGFRLPPLMFGTEEAFAVALGLDALNVLGLTDTAPAAESVRAKLERVLPEAVSAQVGALRGVLGLERPRWVAQTDVGLLTQLANAAHLRRRVSLTYTAHGGEASRRTVEPYGLAQRDGRWFLAAYCCLREGMRLFRVDRIGAAELCPETFERPADFSAAAFVRDSAASPDLWEAVVWLGVPPEVARSWWGGGEATAEAGGTRLCVRVGDLEAFALSLLHLSAQHGGGGLEVRSPTELREAFRALAERAGRVALKAELNSSG